MRHLRGSRTEFEITGDENDAYYKTLPGHDLSALCTFLTRMVARRRLGTFLRRFVEQRPIHTCVDVGANIGLASLLMSELVPSAKIIAFEPVPRTFEYLAENIRQNRCEPRISAHRLAVGREPGSIRFADTVG